MLIVLIGKSGSGKTSFLNFLNDNSNFKKIVTVTSRPKREKEVNGRDYFFWNKKEINKNKNKFLFLERYRNWYYGILRDSIVPNASQIIILTPSELKELKKTKIPHRSIYLKVDWRTRLTARSINLEFLRRSLTDFFYFLRIEKQVDIVIDNRKFSKNFNDILTILKNYSII